MSRTLSSLVVVVILTVATLSNAQSTTISCTQNWCGERWKNYDRIFVYNYTEVIHNVTISKNVTYTRKDCNPLDLLISPNGDGCKIINVTEKKNITFQVPIHQRSTEPEIRELPTELTLGIIATENIDIFGNDSKENYNELEDKVWQIWVPRGCRLVLFFSEFDLESSPNCSKDYLTVQSTKRQKDIPKYCGGISSVPKEITIHRRRAQFHFHSDNTNTRKGVHATYCFQKSTDVRPDDIPCSCNTDISGITRRHARHEESGSRSRSKSRSKSKSKSRSSSRSWSGTETESTKSGSKSQSHKTKTVKMSKKKMMKLMKKQDKEIGNCLRNMMKNGLKSINQYRYSSDKNMRILAEKYQQALDPLMV